MSYFSVGTRSRGLGLTKARRPFINHDTFCEGFWPFQEVDGDRRDMTDRVHFTPSATLGWRAGPSTEIPGAADFTASQELSHPASGHDIIDFRTQDFTFLFVIRFDALTANHNIFKQYGAAGTRCIIVQHDNSGGKLRVLVSTDGNNNTTVDSTVTTAIDTWYWLWVQREGSTVRIGIDDATLATGTKSGDLYDSSEDLVIGDTDFNGAIAQVAFWQDAVSAEYRSLIYNSGTGNGAVYL